MTWTELRIGDEITGPRRVMTAPRVAWYGSGFNSANAGEWRAAPVNIHTDDASAKAQGYTAAIADAMISGNWVHSMLLRTFGKDVIARGHLALKFIKPVFIGEALTPKGVVKAITPSPGGGMRFELDVAVEDDAGAPRTVGTFAVVAE